MRPQKKELLTFPDGTRTVSISGIYITKDAVSPVESINVANATNAEIEKLKKNPYDQKLIDKLTKQQ